MANIRNANTFFIDTQTSMGGATLSGSNIMVHHVIIVGNGGNGSATLVDLVTGDVKFHIHAVDGESTHFQMETVPMVFPTGISCTTLTNAFVTIVLKEQSK